MAIEVKIRLGFRGQNLDAAQQAEKFAGELITVISEESREAIRGLIVKSIRDGVSPYETARRIRDHIGMNRQQMAAAANYEKSLVEQGLNRANIDRLMKTYTARAIRARGLTIARYEIMNSLNQATHTRWLNDQADGKFPNGAMKQLIAAHIGEWPCEICEPLDGMKIDLNQAFYTSRGAFTTPPFHPRCRCVLRLVPREAANEEDLVPEIISQEEELEHLEDIEGVDGEDIDAEDLGLDELDEDVEE